MKAVKPILYVSIFLILIKSHCLGQEIHFSQFYNAPIFLNPALSGLTTHKLRFALNYRNQWPTISTPYNTYAASFDIDVVDDRLHFDKFGLGLILTNDRAGDGPINIFNAMLSAAYHKTLDYRGKQNFSLGIQLGFRQNSVDVSDLTFPNQYNGATLDRTLGGVENFVTSNKNSFSINAGALWHYNIKGSSAYRRYAKIGDETERSIQIGANIKHLNQPTTSFFDDDNKIRLRYIVHGKMEYSLNRDLLVYPMFFLSQQITAREVVFGGNFEYYLPYAYETHTDIIIGAAHRWQDALIFNAGVGYRSIKVVFSYDLNISQLNPASNGVGAFEISITYPREDPPKYSCPKFSDFHHK